MTDEPLKRRPSHLMDPEVLQERYRARVRAEHAAHAAGRPLSTSGETVYVTDRAERRGGMSVQRVRQFVLSALVGATVFHLTLGLAVAGYLMDARQAQVGLCLLAIVTGVLGVVAVRLIHDKPLLTPWLLLGSTLGLGALVVVLSS